jgi:magnesium-transporting ATPase (P-type)
LDEVNFLDMSEKVGVAKFTNRDHNRVSIQLEGTAEDYTILRVIEFSSERKRMTVVAKRESDGKIFSFVKGGDVVIVDRLSQGSRDSNA